MKALVLGASGLIGGALVRALELSGVETIGTYYSRPSSSAQLRVDVTDGMSVARLVEAQQPDVVFLAAELPGGVDFCETHEDVAEQLHVGGTVNVAAAAAARGARLVFYSSHCLFDGKAGPYAEDDAPAAVPLSVYARVKAQAERIVREANRENLIIRTSAVFAWAPQSNGLAMQVLLRLQSGKRVAVAYDQWANLMLASYLSEASVRLCQVAASRVFDVAGRDRQ